MGLEFARFMYTSSIVAYWGTPGGAEGDLCWLALQYSLTRRPGVVAANALQLPAKARPVEGIQQSLDSGQVEVLPAHGQVVALYGQRYETEAEYARSSARGDTAIGSSGAHLPCGGQMS